MNRTKKILALILCSALLGTQIQTGTSPEAKTKLSLNKKKATVYVGKTVKLKVKGTKKKVTWKSAKKKIAVVSKKGVVKGKKAGKTTITAKVAGKKLTCQLTVKKKSGGNMAKATATPKVTASPVPDATATETADAVGDEPVFSKESGSYDKAFQLTLSAPEGSTIYYTTDGSVPLHEESGAVFPAKLDTNTYTGAITVKNRDSDKNLLCSKANIPLMYDPNEFYNGAFYPTVSAVPKATIIRALAVDENGKKSKVVTKVYFVDKNLNTVYKNASVISIVTDPDNLLSEETGIYRYGNWNNKGDAWERPADVTYFDEDGTIPFETTMGVRIHGGYTRIWGQKSLRLYFREELGMKNLKGYQLIPSAVNTDGTPTTKYKQFILRNGGNEYAYSKMQDVFIQSMVEDCDFATQSARPCVLFLNGEYWGLYNLTERYSDNYLEQEYGVDKNNVVMIKNDELDEGEKEDYALYEELLKLANEDMSKTKNYKKFQELFDIESYLDYYATEIYIGNNDWPVNNTQLWRTRTDDGTKYGDTKWRFMLFDTEYSMDLWGSDNGGNKNRIEAAKTGDNHPLTDEDEDEDGEEITYNLFAALCKNKEFCQALADRLMKICRENFDVTKANAKLDEMAAVYRPLIAQSKARFGTYGDVDSRVNDIKTYIAGRESQLKQQIKESFGITVQ